MNTTVCNVYAFVCNVNTKVCNLHTNAYKVNTNCRIQHINAYKPNTNEYNALQKVKKVCLCENYQLPNYQSLKIYIQLKEKRILLTTLTTIIIYNYLITNIL